jgi:Family of unknown function (DUF6502)
MPKGRSNRRQMSVAIDPRVTKGAEVLQALLTELAFVLLPRGMTPKRFSDMVRAAFVQVAADISRLRNGKVNHSRVAAQTGVSRADVKKLLKGDVFASPHRSQTAIEKVIEGWRTDREFTPRPGKPRRLSISGPRSSFARLVQKYGGDVPPRAVLDELRQIGAVVDVNGFIFLRTSPSIRQRHDFGFLSPVLPALVDGLRIAAKKGSARAASSIHRLTLPAETEVDLAIVRDRCISSTRSMLDGLAHSLGAQAASPRSRRHPNLWFSVTVLLAENGSKEKQRPRGNVGDP